jgi:hypothetical protein
VGCRRTIRVRKEAVTPNPKRMHPTLLARLESEGGFAPVAMDGRTMVLAARQANLEMESELRAAGATDQQVSDRLVRIECRAEKVSDDMAMGIMILANSYHREDDVFTKATKAADSRPPAKPGGSGYHVRGDRGHPGHVGGLAVPGAGSPGPGQVRQARGQGRQQVRQRAP